MISAPPTTQIEKAPVRLTTPGPFLRLGFLGCCRRHFVVTLLAASLIGELSGVITRRRTDYNERPPDPDHEETHPDNQTRHLEPHHRHVQPRTDPRTLASVLARAVPKQ